MFITLIDAAIRRNKIGDRSPPLPPTLSVEQIRAGDVGLGSPGPLRASRQLSCFHLAATSIAAVPQAGLHSQMPRASRTRQPCRGTWLPGLTCHWDLASPFLLFPLRRQHLFPWCQRPLSGPQNSSCAYLLLTLSQGLQESDWRGTDP